MNRSNGNDPISRALRALAEEEANVEAPAHVEAAVMARWDAVHTPRHRGRGIVRGAATLAAGVSLVGAVALQREFEGSPVELPRHPTMAFVERDAAHRAAPSATQGSAKEKVEQGPSTLVLVGDPSAAGEIVHVVRMRMDRASLTALGVVETTSSDVVDVDVLVGEDGVARGLRVAL